MRVLAATNDTVLVRSRGATPERAAEATETYVASYVDVRRRQIEAEVSAATEAVLRKTGQIKSQLESAEEPQRTSLVELLGVLNTQLDRLQGDHWGPTVIGSTPAEAVHDWPATTWFVAVLGAMVAAGAAAALRPRRRSDER